MNTINWKYALTRLLIPPAILIGCYWIGFGVANEATRDDLTDPLGGILGFTFLGVCAVAISLLALLAMLIWMQWVLTGRIGKKYNDDPK
jgi:hypothetical protein